VGNSFWPNGVVGTAMALFVSTFANKVDKKARVSIPSAFRSALVGEVFQGIIAYPSFVHPCIEACGYQRLEKMSETIDMMDPFSEERDAFATSILGQAVQLAYDETGRVVLPESLLTIAALEDEAVFVGKGQTFEIWNPQNFARYSEQARALAKERRGQLRFLR
jgi:MraZ protein